MTLKIILSSLVLLCSLAAQAQEALSIEEKLQEQHAIQPEALKPLAQSTRPSAADVRAQWQRQLKQAKEDLALPGIDAADAKKLKAGIRHLNVLLEKKEEK